MGMQAFDTFKVVPPGARQGVELGQPWLPAGMVWVGYGMRFAEQSPVSQLEGPRTRAVSASERVLRELEERHVLPLAYLEGFASAFALARSCLAYSALRPVEIYRSTKFARAFAGCSTN